MQDKERRMSFPCPGSSMRESRRIQCGFYIPTRNHSKQPEIFRQRQLASRWSRHPKPSSAQLTYFFATTCSKNQGNQIFNGGMNQKFKRVINLIRLKAGTCILRRAMGLVYFVLVSFAVFDWPALCNNCILHGPLQVTATSFFPCTRFLSAIISRALILPCTSFLARKSMDAT